MSNRENNCPALVEAKIHLSDSGIGIKKNWVKDLCLECPYDECFLDTKRKSPSREVKYGGVRD